jgi:cullin-associated NEDD8-dissociated protein 1
LPGQVTNPTRKPDDPSVAAELPGGRCPAYVDTQKWRTTDFKDILNATVSISPKRPSANVPTGQWIQGRATYYGTDDRLEKIRVACGEPKDQFGVIAQGSCGYTNSDGSLPFPREVYAAAADTNEDYPGSCGRCYEVSTDGR